jgi:hypothetical protein
MVIPVEKEQRLLAQHNEDGVDKFEHLKLIYQKLLQSFVLFILRSGRGGGEELGLTLGNKFVRKGFPISIPNFYSVNPSN